MTRLSTDDISVELPSGWEGEIRPAARPSTDLRVAGASAEGETRPTVIHLANFPLPAERADYGGGVVEQMGLGDALITLIDFGPEAAGAPLFAKAGLPLPLRRTDFSPSRLQRTLRGQTGTQQFFNVAGRGYCLYIVLGSHLDRSDFLPMINQVLRSVRLGT